MSQTAPVQRPTDVKVTTGTTALSPCFRKRLPLPRQARQWHHSLLQTLVRAVVGSPSLPYRKTQSVVDHTGTHRTTASMPMPMTITRIIRSQRVCLPQVGRHLWVAVTDTTAYGVLHRPYLPAHIHQRWPPCGHQVETVKEASTHNAQPFVASSARIGCVQLMTDRIREQVDPAHNRRYMRRHSDRVARASRVHTSRGLRPLRFRRHYRGKVKMGTPIASVAAAQASLPPTTARITRQTAHR